MVVKWLDASEGARMSSPDSLCSGSLSGSDGDGDDAPSCESVLDTATGCRRPPSAQRRSSRREVVTDSAACEVNATVVAMLRAPRPAASVCLWASASAKCPAAPEHAC